MERKYFKITRNIIIFISGIVDLDSSADIYNSDQLWYRTDQQSNSISHRSVNMANKSDCTTILEIHVVDYNKEKPPVSLVVKKL